MGEIPGGFERKKATEEKTSTRQKEVLDTITTRPTITRKALAKELGNINESAVQKHIEALKRNNVIERIGSDAMGYWKVLYNS